MIDAGQRSVGRSGLDRLHAYQFGEPARPAVRPRISQSYDVLVKRTEETVPAGDFPARAAADDMEVPDPELSHVRGRPLA